MDRSKQMFESSPSQKHGTILGPLAEMKIKLHQLFPKIKLVSFLHSRKNQIILNGWFVFHDAKGLIDVRSILETDRPFGLEVIREGDAAQLQLTTPKMGKKWSKNQSFVR